MAALDAAVSGPDAAPDLRLAAHQYNQLLHLLASVDRAAFPVHPAAAARHVWSRTQPRCILRINQRRRPRRCWSGIRTRLLWCRNPAVVVQEPEAKSEVSRSREAAGAQTTEVHNVSACLPSIPNILKLRCLIRRGVKRCIQQINKANRGKLTPEELKERQGKAMQDPEIQNILTDPVMRQVLIDFQENSRAAQDGSGARTQRRSGLCIVGFSDWRRGHSSPTDLCRHGLRA